MIKMIRRSVKFRCFQGDRACVVFYMVLAATLSYTCYDVQNKVEQHLLHH